MGDTPKPPAGTSPCTLPDRASSRCPCSRDANSCGSDGQDLPAMMGGLDLARRYSSVAALTAWAKRALSRNLEASSSEMTFCITLGLSGMPVRSSKPVLSVARSRLPSIKGRSGARAAGTKRVLSVMPSVSARTIPCWPWCTAG